MEPKLLNKRFVRLSTPLISDACLRLKIPLRIAPQGIRSVVRGIHLAGRALPVRHYGSVDIFLEAIITAASGDVLVIDNQGRTDEACIGDLTVLEAQSAKIGGIVLWGVHRDTVELRRIMLPVFSYGMFPGGPRRLDARQPNALEVSQFGALTVTREDAVLADDDGVVFVPWASLESVLDTAETIAERERRQADLIRSGRTLRQQLEFDRYLETRNQTVNHTFRDHLEEIKGAIEV